MLIVTLYLLQSLVCITKHDCLVCYGVVVDRVKKAALKQQQFADLDSSTDEVRSAIRRVLTVTAPLRVFCVYLFDGNPFLQK